MRHRIATFVCVVACIGGAAAAQGPAGPAETPAAKAGKLYTTAISALRTGQLEQTQVLLARFVRVYSTHEYVPVAYLQLAYCRHQQKDYDGYQAALDEVIGRFPGSPAWFCAYGSKLGRAAGNKEHEKYLTLLAEFVQRAKEAPLDLHGNISWSFGDYNHAEYEWQHRIFQPTAGMMGSLVRRPGWVMTLVKVADTPARAERALEILAPTLQKRARELPTDWQFAHVRLLEAAGKAAEADKQFRQYVEQWGDDPRGIGLWLLRAGSAAARKDTEAVEAIYQRLVKSRGGAGSLEETWRNRLWDLCRRDEYEKFKALARHYLKAYSTSRYFDHVVGLWVGMAEGTARKGDASRIPETLKMLEDLAATEHPLRQRANLIRKINLQVLAKDYDSAAAGAMELIDEKHWSAESFQLISRYARTDKAFARVLDAARDKWNIPLPSPVSKAFVLLNKLKMRLKDQASPNAKDPAWSLDQVRHAEEIGEEMFGKYRDDASTIEAVKLLADFYFKKVLPEPRDKWMARMVQTYTHHPLTQAVLLNQVVAEGAARRFDRQAAALDTIAERFPAATASGSWYHRRLRCYEAAKDGKGRAAFITRYYRARAEAGEIEAINEFLRCEHASLGGDSKAIGDDLMARARRSPGTRLELHYLWRAWSAYYWSHYYANHRPEKICWAEAKEVTRALQTQRYDPELRWKMAFADINLMAHKIVTRTLGEGAGPAEGKALLAAIHERIPADATFRDLSLRLDFAAVGAALGKSGLVREGVELARRLGKVCTTRRDAGAIEMMLAGMHSAIKNHLGAAGHYLRIVEACPWPIRRYWHFSVAMSHLRAANSPRYAAEMDQYMRKIGRVQGKVPELMFQLGYRYLETRDRAALEVRKNLVKRYPASSARDRLEMEIAKRLQKR